MHLPCFCNCLSYVIKYVSKLLLRDSSSLQLGWHPPLGLCLIIQVFPSRLPFKKKLYWRWHEQSHCFVCSLLFHSGVP